LDLPQLKPPQLKTLPSRKPLLSSRDRSSQE
jgi:hypothetical protein